MCEKEELLEKEECNSDYGYIHFKASAWILDSCFAFRFNPECFPLPFPKWFKAKEELIVQVRCGDWITYRMWWNKHGFHTKYDTIKVESCDTVLQTIPAEEPYNSLLY